jgi:hypothetical protein
LSQQINTDEHRFIIITLLVYFGWSPTPAKMPPAQRSNKHLTMKSLILQEDLKLNYNNPISPPGKGRGELEITDVNNEYIRQGAMGYSLLDGYWSDAGTFESLLRAGMMVKKHMEKKEGTADERK